MDDLPSFDLTGQTALVTGAGRGLGRAIALALAAAGADVALGLRDADADGGLGERIAGMGRRAVRLQMDVTDLGQSRAAIDRAEAELGGLDILVNNAGGGIDAVALDVTEADFDTVVALNVKSTFFLSQHAARLMIARGRGGRIVNLSSQAAVVALPGEPVYCLAKAAVSHLTRCLAVEWGEHGITVNAVAPTFIETPGTAPRPGRRGVPRRHGGADRGAAPHRQAGRGGRRRRLPRLARRVAGHRTHAGDRWRMDGEVVAIPPPPPQGPRAAEPRTTFQGGNEMKGISGTVLAGALVVGLSASSGLRQDVLLDLARLARGPGLDLLPGGAEQWATDTGNTVNTSFHNGDVAAQQEARARRHRRRRGRHRHHQPRPGQPGRGRQGSERSQHPDHQLQHPRPDGELRRLCRRRQRRLRPQLGAVPRRQRAGEVGRLRLDAGGGARAPPMACRRRRGSSRSSSRSGSPTR